ncbi:MAG: flagellar hook-basal body protein [Eubacteriales bacterium]
MVRSLWTGATGMIAQQNNVDTIANNLANVNTTGYKSEVAEFKSLLYQTIQSQSTTANGDPKPVSAQVGLGVRNSSITSNFTQGNFYSSTSSTAFAIGGDGFFAYQGQDGETYYTRAGDFKISMAEGGFMLATPNGEPILNTEGEPLIFDSDLDANKIVITSTGEFTYPDENNNLVSMDISIGLFQFTNPAGLEKLGNSSYAVTDASGEAINEADNEAITPSEIAQGYLEGSNVQIVDEMVNMIVAQRAYEMNSKAITTSDEMMQQANQLKR